ncbi:MAG: hypothetical protein Q8K36_07360 [Alphaproteobacteria bacterium]|nr:hypothetical protein [Alphaproteobacteria bacterium]
MKNTNHLYLYTSIFAAVTLLFLPDTAEALTGGGIVGIDNLWAKIKPYLTGAFSIGGVIYCATNVRKVVVGDYRAAAPAAISAILAGLGIQGVFGDNALTATVNELEPHVLRAISE